MQQPLLSWCLRDRRVLLVQCPVHSLYNPRRQEAAEHMVLATPGWPGQQPWRGLLRAPGRKSRKGREGL